MNKNALYCIIIRRSEEWCQAGNACSGGQGGQRNARRRRVVSFCVTELHSGLRGKTLPPRVLVNKKERDIKPRSSAPLPGFLFLAFGPSRPRCGFQTNDRMGSNCPCSLSRLTNEGPESHLVIIRLEY